MTLHQSESSQESLSRPAHEPIDWTRVVRTFLLSRALDDLEESRLLPEKRILYQFSARGHELGQILLGTMLTRKRDGVSGYYRSRPLLLTLGLSVTDALKSGMGKGGGISDGRDIGVVFNMPSDVGCVVLPMAGGVGTQYTTTAGWAHAIRYHSETLADERYRGCIGVVLGGDGSVATNGFWAALNIATTRKLPMLFFLEDNGYGLSVPSSVQTPGGDIARNLESFRQLRILHADSTHPAETAQTIHEAVQHVRSGAGPVLLRLIMPRLCGHSGQDTQAYKSREFVEEERMKDPLPALRSYLVPNTISELQWHEMETEALESVQSGFAEALASCDPDTSPVAVVKHLFAEDEVRVEASPPSPPEPARINMLTAIRRTLESELKANPKLLVFGEDVGAKGGVHAATMGLQAEFGAQRVFDTSLSEEGIVGTAVGMAMAGLRPVAEIQFRKYADPAMEQLNDCGTIRWRTASRFHAPIVVRMPGGFGSKCGDPWHSVSSEVTFAHAMGWQVIYPSNAEDAAGLLRTAMRSQNPSIFFEHRAQLDSAWARRPYPGDMFALPLGLAKRVQRGTDITLVTWGAMVERCMLAAAESDASADIIDLRTIVPWDKETVLNSVRRTHRCLIVHEDTITAGFGAEIAAVIGREAFLKLDAPVERLAVPDIPLPYNVPLLEAVLPTVGAIARQIRATLDF
ncbi:MAG: thiamine pyrophosphate-dependent enzyme [Acidobacteriota bacterium]|nr:thiamine pyrophosphate-dependent enzyme [Acidobacteriota bacterium]